MTDRTENFSLSAGAGQSCWACRLCGAFCKRNYKYAPQEARLDFMGGLGCALFSRY
jgi:hypothetical protein